tara:strand:+ start:3279 stop:3422 length:144 start_codon:yes stop_codon:yes gene_type:complete
MADVLGRAGARQRGVGYETVTIPGVKFLNRSFAACPSGGSKTYYKKT